MFHRLFAILVLPIVLLTLPSVAFAQLSVPNMVTIANGPQCSAPANVLVSCGGAFPYKTPSFTVIGDWDMSWSFGSCGPIGTAAFIAEVLNADGTVSANPRVAKLSAGDSGVQHYHIPGTYTISVSTLCIGSVSVTQVSNAPAVTTSTSAAPPFGDGTYIVGTDIAAGTYRAPGGDSCYWERLSGFGGTSAEIIANGQGKTSPIVTIASGDAGFDSSSCGTWAKAS